MITLIPDHALSPAPIWKPRQPLASISGRALLVIALMLISAFALADDTTEEETTSVVDFFQYTVDWLGDGIYKTADTVLERIQVWIFLWYLELKISMISMAASIADVLVASLSITENIKSAISGLDSRTAAMLYYLRIPDALSMLFSAYITRFILDLF
ncbi:DUF2523 family protein [Oceanobacter mangrovi]|uniref:DUF2523 family protein n=1 Tax=Oceanobacter mangrovi TaxID=2862510 RepID=UPI001C8DC380|nr:DUF2523 family protein [Oceanobacter mangrovi]